MRPDHSTPVTSSAAGRPPGGWLRGAFLLMVVIAGGMAGWQIRAWRDHSWLVRARAEVKKRPAQAAVAYREYLQRFPDDSSVRLEFATALMRSHPAAALVELREIPPTAREFLAAARMTATIALDLGRDYDALDPLLYLEERLPEDAGVQLTLAVVRFHEKRFEEAARNAARCRELNPYLVEPCLVQAHALSDMNRSAEAVEPLTSALQLDPELPLARLNLAFALQHTGRAEDALLHVQWFLRRFPDSAAGYRILALVEQQRGRTEEALDAIHRADEFQLPNLENVLIEAELLLRLNHADEAFQRLSPWLALAGDQRRMLTLLAQAARLSNHTEEAAKYEALLNQPGSVIGAP